MIGQQIAQFRIIDFLGEGDTGSVYSAEDLNRHRLVAVRILDPRLARDPEYCRRLDENLRAAQEIDHPGVPRIYQHGVAGPVRFVAMQLLDGETLESRLRKASLSPAEAVQVASEVAEALVEAHERRITHRDLKPSNIMLCPGGARLLALGMPPIEATVPMEDLEGSSRREPYKSPEQLQGSVGDERSDIFSLGVILYEMVTSRRPFGGENPAEIRRALLHDAPEAPTALRGRLPLSLDRVILKALAKNPTDRQTDAKQLLAELREAGQDLNALALVHAPLRRRRRRHFGIFLPVAATILVLVIIWLVWQVMRKIIP